MEIVFNKTKKVLLILVLTLLFIGITTSIFAADPFHLNATAIVMYQGREFDLAANKNNVKYESSNERVATVDSNGVIEAKRMGIVTITATAPNGETATCKVRVKMKTTLIDKIRGASLSISSINTYKGQRLVIMEGLVAQGIKEWKCSNENVVKIARGSKYAVILDAKNPGTAKITATTSKGIKITVNIVVKELEIQAAQPATKKLDSIKITKAPNKTTYTEGENFDKAGMTVQAIYDDGTKQNITNYTVTDGNKLPAGKTSVTISYTEGGVTKTTTQTIKVNKKAEVTALTITPGSATIAIGEKITLKANKSVTWTISAGSDIISLNGSGIFIGVKGGTATVTAKTAEGQTANCKITVDPYRYMHNGNVYKIIVKGEKLNQVLAKIDSANIEQTTNRYASDGLAGECARVATYYMKMLNGVQNLDTASRTGAKNCSTSYVARVWNTTGVKNIVDTKSYARLFLENDSSSMHWAVIIGYKVGEDGKQLSDYLLLDPGSGKLAVGGTGGCLGLYDEKWQANIVYDNR